LRLILTRALNQRLSTASFNSVFQQRLSTASFNSVFQPRLSTASFNRAFQQRLSTAPFNSAFQQRLISAPGCWLPPTPDASNLPASHAQKPVVNFLNSGVLLPQSF